MRSESSRRRFLASAALLPAAEHASVTPASKVTLGRTGLQITRLVYGSMITSDPAVIETAVDMGINCFTTSREYQGGNNERLLGAALKGKRQRLVLCTEAIDMMWRPKSEKETKQYVVNNLDLSLRELQTDCVDVYFLHHKDEPGWVPDEAIEALETAKRQGKIRHAGLTTHSLPKMADYLVKHPFFEAVIPIYNFTMDAEVKAAAKKVHDAGTGLIAMKVMAGGLSGDKVLPQLKRAGGAAAALKWVLNSPHVDAAVTSIADMDQLEENFRSMSEPFRERDRETLDSALWRIDPHYCRMCSRCEGTCVKGLPVPEILRCGMYAVGYGQFALGREKFLQLPEEVRNGFCGECSQCTVRCAYGVRVAERVTRTRELLA